MSDDAPPPRAELTGNSVDSDGGGGGDGRTLGGGGDGGALPFRDRVRKESLFELFRGVRACVHVRKKEEPVVGVGDITLASCCMNPTLMLANGRARVTVDSAGSSSMLLGRRVKRRASATAAGRRRRTDASA